MTQFTVELDRETDGRWIAEISALPGALCYGSTKDEASRKVEALALRILADRIENKVADGGFQAAASSLQRPIFGNSPSRSMRRSS
jgi:predicted RNase H-like HicB family nuclease